MTDISVVNTGDYQVEKRDWLAGPHGTEPGANPTITLDIALFTEATHYPKGYIPSGTAVSKVAAGTWGPYDATKTEHALTFASVNAKGGSKVATGGYVHGFVYAAKLPQPLDATARADFPLIHFSD